MSQMCLIKNEVTLFCFFSLNRTSINELSPKSTSAFANFYSVLKPMAKLHFFYGTQVNESNVPSRLLRLY